MLLNNPRLSLTVTNKRGFNYLQFAVLKGNTRYVIKLWRSKYQLQKLYFIGYQNAEKKRIKSPKAGMLSSSDNYLNTKLRSSITNTSRIFFFSHLQSKHWESMYHKWKGVFHWISRHWEAKYINHRGNISCDIPTLGSKTRRSDAADIQIWRRSKI